MRRDRDSLFILICLVPALYLVYAFFTWEATGSWPLNLPYFNLPTIPVPGFLHPVQQQSPELRRLVNQFTANWFTICIGTAVGLVFGIFLVGLIADAVKALFRIGRPTETLDTSFAEVEAETLTGESA